MKPALTANQLKILAMITMTADHVGVYLLPQYRFLRVIGRLAMPIYAYMIAEGCKHTRDRKKYLLQIAGMALLCQLAYLFVVGSLFQCILVTFTLSVVLIYALESPVSWHAPAAALGAVLLTEVLPRLLENTDYSVDYGLLGVLLPVAVYLGKTRKQKLLLCALMLALLSLQYGGVQWAGLVALVPLWLYGGARGKANIKWLFYLYYPLHLATIYGIRLLF